jgi:TRAP-type C4-dicarboxylate transport system permease large subunit
MSLTLTAVVGILSLIVLLLLGVNIGMAMMAASGAICGSTNATTATIERLAVSRYIIFAFIIVIYAILGCFMDALPMIMLTVPIFLPVILNLGFDPIWFGVIIIMVMMMGLITPPVGMNCYVMSGIAKDVPLYTIFRGAIPYTIALLIGIIILTVAPGLATWLPTLIYG